MSNIQRFLLDMMLADNYQMKSLTLSRPFMRDVCKEIIVYAGCTSYCFTLLSNSFRLAQSPL